MQGKYRRQMMNTQETANFAVECLVKNGADKAQCRMVNSERHELNVTAGDMSLFRTTFDTSIDLLGLVDNKKGTVMMNKIDTDSIGQGVQKVLEYARSSKSDPANDIAGYQPPKSFSDGPLQADLDTMYTRLKEFLTYSKGTYPNTIIEDINFDFTRTESIFVNSNGVEFHAETGSYHFNVMFTSKEGSKTSSANYTGLQFNDLSIPIKDIGGLDRLLNQSAQQLDVENIPEKFDGSIIVTPECLGDFIDYFTRYISSYSMITGTSIYKDKLNQKIATNNLTLHSKPTGTELASSYYFTDDGFEVKNSTLIENGILKSFLINLYAANKTGYPRSDNMGWCYVIEAGDSTLDEMIRSTKKGILLCRFSAGNPGENGDFSGVAKNSYYIENGKIQYPVTETMISGNIVQMLNNIEQISSERNNDGYNCFPWIKFGYVTVSGK
jgi:PmbA protein